MIEQPFEIDVNGDIKNTTDEEKQINARLAQLILTQGYYEGKIGELPWDIYFGSGVPLLRHSQAREQQLNQVSYYITQAIKKYMPEITEVNVNSYHATIDTGIALIINIAWKKLNISGTVEIEV